MLFIIQICMVYVPWLYYTNQNIYLCEGTRKFILVHIFRRIHSYLYSSYTILNLYIYLDGGTYHVLILLSILYLFRFPVGVYRTYAYIEVPLGTTKLILISYGLYLYYGGYTCLEVPVGTTEILRNVYWYCGTYPYTEVPVSMTKLILVLRILYLYYEAYPGLTELILVLLNLFLYFRSYTCIKKLIHVFQILYLFYRAYTYLTDLILALRNMYLSYGSYTCFTELILIFRISYLCEGTRRYDKSEQIIIISHTRSDQTYADTYTGFIQIQNISKNKLIIGLYHNHIQSYTCSEVPVGNTGLILILQNLYLFYRYESTHGYYKTYTYFTDMRVPVGTT